MSELALLTYIIAQKYKETKRSESPIRTFHHYQTRPRQGKRLFHRGKILSLLVERYLQRRTEPAAAKAPSTHRPERPEPDDFEHWKVLAGGRLDCSGVRVEELLYLIHLMLVQTKLGGPDICINLRGTARANDRGGHGGICQNPGDRGLAG